MTNRYGMIATLALTSLTATAQDAYDAGNLLQEDLNGTARYVGMGGALDALGADLSTISTNPAGMGLFRHSEASLSFGLVSQQNAVKFGGVGATNMSFDQVGFVYSTQTSNRNFVNVAFNFHKNRNFDQILSAANNFAPSTREVDQATGNLVDLRGSGLSLPTNMKGLAGLLDKSNEDANGMNYYESEVDYKMSNLLLFDIGYVPLTAAGFGYNRGTSGYIGEYNFNVSGNSKDRVYWGVTVGIHDVRYEAFTGYVEALESGQKLPNGTAVSQLRLDDERSIKGTGFDIKAGIIIRPIDESPFRVGLSIASPTWYSLTTNNYTTLAIDQEDHNPGESYDFKFYTPWKFGVSLGHTIGKSFALGAGYEFSDFSSADMRYITYSGYDGSSSRSDKDMNTEIGAVLKGVHTLKAGVELKPDPAVAVRLGYNYVSAIYASDGWRNQTIYSPGVCYASTTDYTNWKGTHRITAGIGTRINKLKLDLAYQYSMTKGDFYPFTDYQNYEEAGGFYMENKCSATPVDFKRHQVLLTLGYIF